MPLQADQVANVSKDIGTIRIYAPNSEASNFIKKIFGARNVWD